VTAPVLNRLRQATGDLHRRIEQRFDAVAELADPARRPAVVDRYAAFYSSAHRALAAALEQVEGLSFPERRRAWEAVRVLFHEDEASPAFPEPANSLEALGSFYVVEGSTLGGRLILRELQKRGVADIALRFLDPYGSEGGSMWRSLLAVLEREGGRGAMQLESICRGATRGFAHAEHILCSEVQ